MACGCERTVLRCPGDAGGRRRNGVAWGLCGMAVVAANAGLRVRGATSSTREPGGISDWYGHNLGDSVNLRQNLLQGGDKSQEMPAWPGPCQWRIRG